MLFFLICQSMFFVKSAGAGFKISSGVLCEQNKPFEFHRGFRNREIINSVADKSGRAKRIGKNVIQTRRDVQLTFANGSQRLALTSFLALELSCAEVPLHASALVLPLTKHAFSVGDTPVDEVAAEFCKTEHMRFEHDTRNGTFRLKSSRYSSGNMVFLMKRKVQRTLRNENYLKVN